MRKTIIAVVGVIALLAAGTAFAHGWGYGGGQGYGPGYGGHMWGGGQGMMGGYGMMEGYGYNGEETQKFLEETSDVRRELHEKRFDLREAYRAGDKEKAETIGKEIEELQKTLAEKAEKSGFERGPRRGYGQGYGPRAGGYGYCGGPYGR